MLKFFPVEEETDTMGTPVSASAPVMAMDRADEDNKGIQVEWAGL